MALLETRQDYRTAQPDSHYHLRIRTINYGFALSPPILWITPHFHFAPLPPLLRTFASANFAPLPPLLRTFASACG